MHKAEKNLHEALDRLWQDTLDEGVTHLIDIIEERGGDYDNESKIYHRVNTGSQYATMVLNKAQRIWSELSKCELNTGHTWNADSALDLMAYSLFLYTYARFVNKPLKTEADMPWLKAHPRTGPRVMDTDQAEAARTYYRDNMVDDPKMFVYETVYPVDVTDQEWCIGKITDPGYVTDIGWVVVSDWPSGFEYSVREVKPHNPRDPIMKEGLK